MADYTGMTWEYWIEDRQHYGNGFPACTIEIYEGYYSFMEVTDEIAVTACEY